MALQCEAVVLAGSCNVRRHPAARAGYCSPLPGHAEITLNPTRLFAHMAPEVVANAVPALHSYDLRSWSDRAEVLRGRTLDGSDNVIPDDLTQAAIALDWPRFCQDCAHRDLTGWLWTGLIERISQERRSRTCGEVRRRARS